MKEINKNIYDNWKTTEPEEENLPEISAKDYYLKAGKTSFDLIRKEISLNNYKAIELKEIREWDGKEYKRTFFESLEQELAFDEKARKEFLSLNLYISSRRVLNEEY